MLRVVMTTKMGLTSEWGCESRQD